MIASHANGTVSPERITTLSKSKVFFSNARALHYRYTCSLPSKLERLLDRSEFASVIPQKKKVAVKTHFGSSGAFRIVRPNFLRIIVDAIRREEGQPFVTDTGGLYKLDIAVRNGITELSVGAPVIMAGGIKDMDGVPVKTGGPLLESIDIAAAIYDADAMVVVSHAKGHIQSGYGGAIKNIAMGCVTTRSREGENQRGRMHARGEAPFSWEAAKCNFCGQCVDVCSYINHALKIEDNIVTFDKNRCWRCGRCVRVCPTGALSVDLDEKSFAGGMAEASRAVLSTFEPDRVIYINFILEFIPECDCMPMADTPLYPDQGILISQDPVAIDAATLDLIAKAKPLTQSKAEDYNVFEAGEDSLKRITGRDPWLVLRAAEEAGLGSTSYKLVQVEPDK